MQIPFDNVVLLQPTSPLRPPNLLDKCIDSFDRNERGSLATVSPLKFKVGEIADDHFIPLNYSFEQRTQDLKGFYFENGLIYITKKQEIVEGRIFSADLLPYVVDSIHAHIDIDTREDLDYAEFVLSRYRGILDE
jgi:N-acylneuraminate cytidylyltransferase